MFFKNSPFNYQLIKFTDTNIFLIKSWFLSSTKIYMIPSLIPIQLHFLCGDLVGDNKSELVQLMAWYQIGKLLAEPIITQFPKPYGIIKPWIKYWIKQCVFLVASLMSPVVSLVTTGKCSNVSMYLLISTTMQFFWLPAWWALWLLWWPLADAAMCLLISTTMQFFGCQLDELCGFSGDHWQMQQCAYWYLQQCSFLVASLMSPVASLVTTGRCSNVLTDIYNNAVFWLPAWWALWLLWWPLADAAMCLLISTTMQFFGCQLYEPCGFFGDHCQMQQYFNVFTDIYKVLFLVSLLYSVGNKNLLVLSSSFLNLLLSLLLVSKELQDLLMPWSYHCLALSYHYVMAKISTGLQHIMKTVYLSNHAMVCERLW